MVMLTANQINNNKNADVCLVPLERECLIFRLTTPYTDTPYRSLQRKMLTAAV